MRALVVDDSECNRRLIQMMLRRMKFDVLFAADGREAVEILKIQEFDVVFMDVQMPVMDGITATRTIREWEAKSARPRIPIVTVTANEGDGSAEASMAAGSNEHL